MSRHSSGHFTTVHYAVAAGLLYSISSAALPGIAQAASFGKTIITSTQHEPLSATVPVTDINIPDFSVELATDEMYQQLGLQPTDSMTVSFVPLSSTSGNILIQTREPLIVPFTDVVMALNDAGQQTIMPKTLLLPLNNNVLANIPETKVEILTANDKETAGSSDGLEARTPDIYTEAVINPRTKSTVQTNAQNHTKLADKNNQTPNNSMIRNEDTVNQLAKNKRPITTTPDKSAAIHDGSMMTATLDNAVVTPHSATQALVVKQGMPPPLSQTASKTPNTNTTAKPEAALLAIANKNITPAVDTNKSVPTVNKSGSVENHLAVKSTVLATHQSKTQSLLTAEQAPTIKTKGYSLDTLTVQVTRRVRMVNQKTTLDAASHALLLADIAKKTTMSLFAAQAVGLNQIKMLATKDVSEQTTPELISTSSRFDNHQNSIDPINNDNFTSNLPRSFEPVKQHNLGNTKTEGYSHNLSFHPISHTRLPFMMQLDFPIITSYASKNQNAIVSREQEPKVYLSVTNQYVAKDAALNESHYHTSNSLNRTLAPNYK